MTALTPADIERLIALARHDREDVRGRALDVLEVEAQRTRVLDDDGAAFVEFMAQVWRVGDDELTRWLFEVAMGYCEACHAKEV